MQKSPISPKSPKSPSPEAAVGRKSRSRSNSRSTSRSPSRSSSSSGSRSPPPKNSTTSKHDRRSSRSISRSVSRSPKGSRSRSRSPCERIKLSTEESAFVSGHHGSCINKLAKVSGAAMYFDQSSKHGTELVVKGTPRQIKMGVKYAKLVIAQKNGPVRVDAEDNKDDDLTIIPIPADCIGYITGHNGQTMRRFEEEWGTLIFFVEHTREREPKKESVGKLAIFGERRGRRGTELKVMSCVDQKFPGYYTKNLTETYSDEKEWGHDIVKLDSGSISYALGKGGMTRRKLSIASNCIIELIGTWSFFSGTKEERIRGKEYLEWLLKQRDGPVFVPDLEKRNDVTIVNVPQDCIAYVTGVGGRSLRNIEEISGTFCFIDKMNGDNGKAERLLIFGADKKGRDKARDNAETMIRIKHERDRKYGEYIPNRRNSNSMNDENGHHHHHSSHSHHHHHHHHSRSKSPPESTEQQTKKRTSRSGSRSPSVDKKKSKKSEDDHSNHHHHHHSHHSKEEAKKTAASGEKKDEQMKDTLSDAPSTNDQKK